MSTTATVQKMQRLIDNSIGVINPNKIEEFESLLWDILIYKSYNEDGYRFCLHRGHIGILFGDNAVQPKINTIGDQRKNHAFTALLNKECFNIDEKVTNTRSFVLNRVQNWERKGNI